MCAAVDNGDGTYTIQLPVAVNIDSSTCSVQVCLYDQNTMASKVNFSSCTVAGYGDRESQTFEYTSDLTSSTIVNTFSKSCCDAILDSSQFQSDSTVGITDAAKTNAVCLRAQGGPCGVSGSYYC
ncbi:hypothetical protein C0Q70_01260 [Pomacea canaliculata]|uniref:Uncharacterized protein n=1 Tax=Pomacea canaliculata TaxID=400727 RepID=A0A2T7PYY7_POMCA|nr:hypothetical protein C0Q70_01260 [Pomacea canaliculata]